MRKVIRKNHFRPFQIIPACFKPCGLFFIYNKTHSMHRRVKFHSDCAYDLEDKSKQEAWNKLFGMAFGIRGIHKNSIRFGWRWNIAKQKIELCTIEYRNGIATRERLHNCDLDLNQWVDLEIRYEKTACENITYEFFRDGEKCCDSYLDGSDVCTRWGCNLYFGGKIPSPNDKMTVEITKL